MSIASNRSARFGGKPRIVPCAERVLPTQAPRRCHRGRHCGLRARRIALPAPAGATGRPVPRGPGSMSGAPDLPAGFRDTFTSRYVSAGGTRQHVVIGGDGPPLLLIHGWPQSWYAWRLVMPELAQHFTVIAVDQRGIGLTDKPLDGYDTGTLAKDMATLMSALGHERFSVYGTDVGMPIAYALAADHLRAWTS